MPVSARTSPRAWVRRVHGVNACPRHCRSARDVKGGSQEKDELEPATARAAVRARAALQGRQGQQGACVAQGAVQKIATRTFKEAPRAGPTRGSARRLAGAWKSSVERRPELFGTTLLSALFGHVGTPPCPSDVAAARDAPLLTPLPAAFAPSAASRRRRALASFSRPV